MDAQDVERGRRLREWRVGAELTITAAAAQAGVKHPTWIDWESGARKPSLAKALAIESMTKGAVTVEAWGIPADAFLRVAEERRARDAVDADDPATADTLPPEVA